MCSTATGQLEKLKDDHSRLSDEVSQADVRSRELNEKLAELHDQLRDARVKRGRREERDRDRERQRERERGENRKRERREGGRVKVKM